MDYKKKGRERAICLLTHTLNIMIRSNTLWLKLTLHFDLDMLSTEHNLLANCKLHWLMLMVVILVEGYYSRLG